METWETPTVKGQVGKENPMKGAKGKDFGNYKWVVWNIKEKRVE